MKNLLLSIRKLILPVLGWMAAASMNSCAETQSVNHSSHATMDKSNEVKVSPNHAPDQQRIDSLKIQKTAEKKHDSTAVER